MAGEIRSLKEVADRIGIVSGCQQLPKAGDRCRNIAPSMDRFGLSDDISVAIEVIVVKSLMD